MLGNRLKILLLVSLFALVYSSCINDCNNHGTCLDNGMCKCEGNYEGIDCSYMIQNISTDQEITHGPVPYDHYVYYRYKIPPNISHQIILFSATGDLDIYVIRSVSGEVSLPTRHNYDYFSVLMTKRDTLRISAAEKEYTYYMSIYAFRRSEQYTLEVSTGCPCSCGEHGSCVNGSCSCTVGWIGDCCDHQIIQVMPENVYNGSVLFSKHEYYYFIPPKDLESNSCHIEVNETMGNVDVYIMKGALPRIDHYDYADSSDDASFVITIPDVVPDSVYYIDFYGHASSKFNFSIKFSNYDKCSHLCSLHGNCTTGGKCKCQADFSGEYCSQMERDLKIDESISGFVYISKWNYYSYYVNSNNPIQFNVNHSLHQDCDVYVGMGKNPTKTEYFVRDISYSNISIVIDEPAYAKWAIGVYGKTACHYDISISRLSNCPEGCKPPYGSCLNANDICVCSPGYAGVDCKKQIMNITRGQILNGSVSTNEWNYLVFNIKSKLFFILANELNTRGAIWIFARIGIAPTIADYDFSSEEIGYSHLLYDLFDREVHLPIYIGIYGSPFAINAYNNYTITVWSTP